VSPPSSDIPVERSSPVYGCYPHRGSSTCPIPSNGGTGPPWAGARYRRWSLHRHLWSRCDEPGDGAGGCVSRLVPLVASPVRWLQSLIGRILEVDITGITPSRHNTTSVRSGRVTGSTIAKPSPGPFRSAWSGAGRHPRCTIAAAFSYPRKTGRKSYQPNLVPT